MAEGLPNSIYDFTVKDIRGNDVSLSTYRGKVLLIVNVASKCGLTDSNYKELNILYEKYKNQGLEILAFPCNQFAGQEPGNNDEIQEFACTIYKAEFPIFDKDLLIKHPRCLYAYSSFPNHSLVPPLMLICMTRIITLSLSMESMPPRQEILTAENSSGFAELLEKLSC
ncbi:PREDICTED: probable glutathione peroxidase 2 isoform X3 [Nelumbo nucifera]|nr:PREDICTED: probable glutathione peroxidase 2 isoform X3 [Nelumbo nucifera]